MSSSLNEFVVEKIPSSVYILLYSVVTPSFWSVLEVFTLLSDKTLSLLYYIISKFLNRHQYCHHIYRMDHDFHLQRDQRHYCQLQYHQRLRSGSVSSTDFSVTLQIFANAELSKSSSVSHSWIKCVTSSALNILLVILNSSIT